MTLLPGSTSRLSITLAVGGLALGAGVVGMLLLESKASFVSDFSARGPIMGRWKLVDDGGLSARGLAVPESLLFEPFVPRPGELPPPGVRLEDLARLSSGSREVLIENQHVWFEYVPGSGTSPFAEAGLQDGFAMMLGLHDVLGGLLDRLTIGLGPDGLFGPPSAGLGPRISYARD